MSFQLGLVFVAPVLLLPLFNRFTPLPDGELRQGVEAYARAQRFELSGIFSMDGSKRSTKANAFFTGFGRFRRIVLFDTLIQTQTPSELIAVLAHEIGHYKRRHIHRQLAVAAGSSALLFYLLSLFLDPARFPGFLASLGFAQPSLYAGIVLFGILYSPVSQALGLFSLHLSRRYEFEADEFSARTTGKAGELVSALKKLSRDHLSNLRPHPLKVFLEYSHPPVLARVERLRRLEAG
jgi:STE24 endopeptidase